MKFQVVVCDPPWATKDALLMSSTKRGAASHYPVMSINDICNLPVKDVSDPNGCILALWVLGSMLEEGMQVMKAWGFKQKQVFVWVKTKNIKTTYQQIIKAPSLLAGFRDIAVAIRYVIGDNLLAFGMGRLFRQTHEICLIGVNNTQIYKKLENKSQRSVCFDENKGHSIKPDKLQDKLEIMFPNANKLEMFARRSRTGWINIGHDVSNGEDIQTSLLKLTNE